MKEHYIHAYVGNGKGKTTAAAGLALRAIGAGMNVAFISLLKNGSSELKPLKNEGAEVVEIKTEKFSWNMTEEEKEELKNRMKKELCNFNFGKYDLIVFDEILGAYEEGFIRKELLLKLMSLRAEIILTGRKLPCEIAENCDYITEMSEIKHPFKEYGQKARRGIEY